MQSGGNQSYSYNIPGKEKRTLWLNDGEYATDVFEPGDYRFDDALYVGKIKITKEPVSKIIGYAIKEENGFLYFRLPNAI